MTMTTKRERDAELASQLLEQIGWEGEFRHLPSEVDEVALDRFWAKVRVLDGHWVWTGATIGSGVGHFAVRPGYTLKAHRLAWELLRGEIAPGMVLARDTDCPHPNCVKPDCYREATKSEAGQAAGKRGGRGNLKSRPGSIPVNCSQDAVHLLMVMHEQGFPIREIYSYGQRLSLGPATIQHIIKGNARGVR